MSPPQPLPPPSPTCEYRELVADLDVDGTITIGRSIFVKLLGVDTNDTGHAARLGIHAPSRTQITRSELAELAEAAYRRGA